MEAEQVQQMQAEAAFLSNSLQQAQDLNNFSTADKLRTLVEFSKNPWFGDFIVFLRWQNKILEAAFVTPKDIDTFFKREQAFGEAEAIGAFERRYFDKLEELQKQLETENERSTDDNGEHE